MTPADEGIAAAIAEDRMRERRRSKKIVEVGTLYVHPETHGFTELEDRFTNEVFGMVVAPGAGNNASGFYRLEVRGLRMGGFATRSKAIQFARQISDRLERPPVPSYPITRADGRTVKVTVPKD